MSEPFREGMRLPSLEVVAFTRDGFVDFPTLFPGGVTMRMVGRSGRVVTGPATANAIGHVVYDWAVGDLVADTYAVVFIGTDGTGRQAAFPTGTNLEIIVVPMP